MGALVGAVGALVGAVGALVGAVGALVGAAVRQFVAALVPAALSVPMAPSRS